LKMTKTWHLLGERNVGHHVGNRKAMNFVQWNLKAPKMPLSKHNGIHTIWPCNNKTMHAHKILLDLKRNWWMLKQTHRINYSCFFQILKPLIKFNVSSSFHYELSVWFVPNFLILWNLWLD
jgi:hypothetical protein